MIRNNVFAASEFCGIQLGATAGATVSNVKIYENTFYRNGRQNVFVDDAAIDHVEIRNNLFDKAPNDNCHDNALAGCSWFQLADVQVGDAARSVAVDTNGYADAPKILGATDTHPVRGENRYADPAALDFRLLAGSAAIDQGAALPEVLTEFDGTARPQGRAYDLGAFEAIPGP